MLLSIIFSKARKRDPIDYGLFCWHKSPGYFWFRILGYGIHAKRILTASTCSVFVINRIWIVADGGSDV